MKVTVRTPLVDNLAFLLHVKERNYRIRRASAEALPTGKANELSAAIHPPVQKFTVIRRTQESPTTATFRVAPINAHVAFFRAGQYVSVEAEVDGHRVSRPFSIASPPDVSFQDNYYDITVRTKDDGFVAPWILNNWESGTRVQTSDPQGYFYYDSLRDFRTVLCLAGGSGVTPFRSMIPDLLLHEPDVRVLLLYGITVPDEILFREEWERMVSENPDRFLFVPVCSDQSAQWQGERGLLSAALIRNHLPDVQEVSFFICGPEAMHDFLATELGTMKLRPCQVRRENFGGAAAPPSSVDTYTISVRVEGSDTLLQVAADPQESVLVALERAGINPPALCRSGDCGWCRSRLVEGSVRTPDGVDCLRAADRKFGYFHPCNSWPESDLVVRIPKNPKQR